ncbi:hypothetical protein ABZ890_12085 [Streptomyces sp. NPDC046984]|uniref:hypothetical protein n=1 Tax=Streptomyces sp. NPDC046984 TaxID=3155138 RepID=UPI003409BA2E
MYGVIGSGTAGIAGAGALAATGFNTLATVVAATTLVAAGLALHKLLPRRGRNS